MEVGSSDEVECFRNHCRLYFQKSLSNPDCCIINNYSDDDFQASKIVLDALEYQLGNMKEIGLNSDHEDFLNSEIVKNHSAVLKSCRLFIECDAEDSYKEIRSSYPQTQQQQQLLIEYNTIKDEERRLAHLLKMRERRDLLRKLLKESQIQVDSNTSENFVGEYDITTQRYLRHVRSRVQNFVSQYKSNIGTHSLLAGIRKIIEQQIDSGEQICLWKFNSMVISESQSGESYMRDTVSILTLFMIFNPDKDVESKGMDEGNYEDILHSYIHPVLSNSFLKYIMSEIPSHLDAKPTGTFHHDENIFLCNKTRPLVRTNVLGQFDESLFNSVQDWSKSVCDIL